MLQYLTASVKTMTYIFGFGSAEWLKFRRNLQLK